VPADAVIDFTGPPSEAPPETPPVATTPDVAAPAELPLEPVSPVVPPSDVPPAPEPSADRNADGTFKPKGRRADPAIAVQAAIAKQREAERRAEAAERRAADLAAQTTRPTPPPLPPTPGLPAFESFDTWSASHPTHSYEDYIDARTDFRTEQRETQRQQQAQQARAAQDTAVAWQTYDQKIAAAKTRDPQFFDKIDPRLVAMAPVSALAPDAPVTFGNIIAEQILRSSAPDKLLQYFSDHYPDEPQRLAALPPDQFFREIGKIEATLEAPAAAVPPGSAPRPIPVSTAHPPIKPVEGSPQGTDPLEIHDGLSTDEHIRRMNLIEKQRRRG
jgi:hypothetical protein